jgi:hypothetical protein
VRWGLSADTGSSVAVGACSTLFGLIFLFGLGLLAHRCNNPKHACLSGRMYVCLHPPPCHDHQAGVREAEAWLGHGSGLLGRARQLGPHPYVTLSLMPGHSSIPALRTPFQVSVGTWQQQSHVHTHKCTCEDSGRDTHRHTHNLVFF